MSEWTVICLWGSPGRTLRTLVQYNISSFLPYHLDGSSPYWLLCFTDSNKGTTGEIVLHEPPFHEAYLL